MNLLILVLIMTLNTVNADQAYHRFDSLEKYSRVCVTVPERQLAKNSLRVSPHEETPYTQWNEEDHRHSYHALKKIASVWEKTKLTDQYLVYGKQNNDQAFNWEIVPYYKASNIIVRIWQQFKVLLKTIFGGSKLSDRERTAQIKEYKSKFSTGISDEKTERVKNLAKGNDAFCKKEVIDKQVVLEGNRVNVLYNYAPIGFGGERLHFMFVPKKHREKFSDVTEKEYLEMTELEQKLMNHFCAKRKIQDIYLFHKTGKDAGQTVPHFHMHMILASNNRQNFFGKLTVLKNMLFGSSPMKDKSLKETVNKYRAELISLKSKD